MKSWLDSAKRLLPGPAKAKLSKMLFTNLAKLVEPHAIYTIAKTGQRSDECLALGCLPMLVHYYTPVPDIEDLKAREIWSKRTDMLGVDFHPQAQMELLRELASKYGAECNWQSDPTDNPQEFYTENDRFSFGCAASTHLMVRNFKPKRIIEIGSGCSSLVLSAAVLQNQKDGCSETKYTIVDPYPGKTVSNGLPGVSELIPKRVELLPSSFANELEEGDILFIDSGHCVRIGSDINFLIFDVLPRLAPGVLVHFHDIPMPFEYPQIYATNPAFRQFWTESYLLQAFLSFNDQFEILLAMQWIMTDMIDQFKESFPHYRPDVHKQGSGSFWIRRAINSK